MEVKLLKIFKNKRIAKECFVIYIIIMSKRGVNISMLIDEIIKSMKYRVGIDDAIYVSDLPWEVRNQMRNRYIKYNFRRYKEWLRDFIEHNRNEDLSKSIKQILDLLEDSIRRGYDDFDKYVDDSLKQNLSTVEKKHGSELLYSKSYMYRHKKKNMVYILHMWLNNYGDGNLALLIQNLYIHKKRLEDSFKQSKKCIRELKKKKKDLVKEIEQLRKEMKKETKYYVGLISDTNKKARNFNKILEENKFNLERIRKDTQKIEDSIKEKKKNIQDIKNNTTDYQNNEAIKGVLDNYVNDIKRSEVMVSENVEAIKELEYSIKVQEAEYKKAVQSLEIFNNNKENMRIYINNKIKEHLIEEEKTDKRIDEATELKKKIKLFYNHLKEFSHKEFVTFLDHFYHGYHKFINNDIWQYFVQNPNIKYDQVSSHLKSIIIPGLHENPDAKKIKFINDICNKIIESRKRLVGKVNKVYNDTIGLEIDNDTRYDELIDDLKQRKMDKPDVYNKIKQKIIQEKIFNESFFEDIIV